MLHSTNHSNGNERTSQIKVVSLQQNYNLILEATQKQSRIYRFWHAMKNSTLLILIRYHCTTNIAVALLFGHMHTCFVPQYAIGNFRPTFASPMKQICFSVSTTYDLWLLNHTVQCQQFTETIDSLFKRDGTMETLIGVETQISAWCQHELVQFNPLD